MQNSFLSHPACKEVRLILGYLNSSQEQNSNFILVREVHHVL